MSLGTVALTVLGLVISYAAPQPFMLPGRHATAKILKPNWNALERYGHKIGKPLLVKNCGPMTNLYSALAPKRSFVGCIKPGFYKDYFGRMKYRDDTIIAVMVS